MCFSALFFLKQPNWVCSRMVKVQLTEHKKYPCSSRQLLHFPLFQLCKCWKTANEQSPNREEYAVLQCPWTFSQTFNGNYSSRSAENRTAGATFVLFPPVYLVCVRERQSSSILCWTLSTAMFNSVAVYLLFVRPTWDSVRPIHNLTVSWIDMKHFH